MSRTWWLVALLLAQFVPLVAAPVPDEDNREERTGLVHVFESHTDIVWAAALSPSGQTSFSGGGGDYIGGVWGPGEKDHAVRVWDNRTGKLLRKLDSPKGTVNSIVVSRDGHRLYFNSGDTVRVFDLENDKELDPITNAGATACLSLSADRKLLLVGGHDRGVRLWDVETRKPIRSFEGHPARVWDVALSPDGTRAVSCGDELIARVWDVKTGKEVRQLTGHGLNPVRCVFTPDGKRILTGAWDNTARLWEADNGKEVFRLDHKGRVEGLAITKDGKRAVTGSLDKLVRLWDLETGKLLESFEGHTGPVARVAVSPDGKYALSASWDKTARLWRLPK